MIKPIKEHFYSKDKLFKMFVKVNKIFNKNKIWYVMAYGTLLGSIRHWDFVPWDDDIDLLILKQDTDKLESLYEELESNGLKLQKLWKLYRIWYGEIDKSEFIDLFVVDNVGGKATRCLTKYNDCIPLHKRSKWWYKGFNFDYKKLHPRKKLKFKDGWFWAPAQSFNLIKDWYGENVLNECKTHYIDHETGSFITPKSINCGDLPQPQLK
jgi:hypothetical protein